MTTHETKAINFSGVTETLLVTLYLRAMESQRSDALIKDEKAVELVNTMNYDFSRIKLLHLSEANKAAIILRNREFDRCTRDFLARHPDAVVVHIGCGLDSGFERVDNGRVEWYDLDLPDVIALRRKHLGDEGGRYHLLASSLLENAWLETVSAHRQRPFLFLAETVFVYFVEAQVKSLVLTLRDHFPGAELVFDGWTPFNVWVGNRWISPSKFAGLLYWGFWRGQEIEGWGNGIHMLDEWSFFDRPEPRMDSFCWMAPSFACSRYLLPSTTSSLERRDSS